MIRSQLKEASRTTIKTARTKEAINEAAKQGVFPLIKPALPSPDIWSKVMVLQNEKTGEIETVGDFRSVGDELFKPVTDFIKYYPHDRVNPYAAYLIPPDLQPGDEVYLEDLIEDIRSVCWNQGDSIRLQSCRAIWDGKDFILNEADKQTAASPASVG